MVQIQKLVKLVKNIVKSISYIETSKLPLQTLSKFNKIGITAGTSTTDWIIGGGSWNNGQYIQQWNDGGNRKFFYKNL